MVGLDGGRERRGHPFDPVGPVRSPWPDRPTLLVGAVAVPRSDLPADGEADGENCRETGS